MDQNWAQGPAQAAEDPAAMSIPSVPVAAPATPEPSTRLVEGRRSPLQTLEAFEGVYRSSPDEFATIAGVAELTPEARRMLASLLMLSAPAREALVEMLQLGDDVRDVILRVLAFPDEVRDTLRVFLTP
jgi:hypothetical protein